MKKIFGNLGNNFLSREQMKNIKGGLLPVDDDGDTSKRKWHQCCCPGAGCAWTYDSCSDVTAMGGREGCFVGNK